MTSQSLQAISALLCVGVCEGTLGQAGDLQVDTRGQQVAGAELSS